MSTPRRSYWEKLRDPRWQKRRLEVLERANWACEHCGAADRELQVHHAAYLRSREPWDYPGESLVSLCRDCHETEQAKLESLAELICTGMVTVGQLVGYAKAAVADERGLGLEVDDYEDLRGIADYLAVTDEEMHQVISESGYVSAADIQNLAARARRWRYNQASAAAT